jgi:DNA-binding beta-propeller fold protein YncE
MDPANDGTPNAIVNRVRVTPDIDAKGSGAKDTPASGQPVNVVLSPDSRYAYIVNHSGAATPAAADAFQHGHADSVTVLNVAKALDPANAMTLNAVDAIIPTGNFGPVGLTVTPDGALVAVANREDARTGVEGNTVSLIDVDKAVAGAKGAEVARLLVGTNNPAVQSRPFSVAFSPDGKLLLASNFRTNNLSFIDVAKALAGENGAEIAPLALATPGGAPARPRGIVFTPDGKYAAVTGAPRGAPGSGVLWIVDVAARKSVSRVTGVGNETYLLALVPAN